MADALNSEAAMLRELRTAGFVDCTTQIHRHVLYQSADEIWAGVAEGFGPVVQMRARMDPNDWATAAARGRAWLAAHHAPDDPLEYVGIVGVGRRP